MAATRTPTRTSVSLHQGELLSGTQPDLHFPAGPDYETAYGISVSLEERNKSLQSAMAWLGRLARTNSFLEIGKQQAEGRRTPAVKSLEARYSQEELEEKFQASEEAKTGMEAATEGDLKKAFGYEPLKGFRNLQDEVEKPVSDEMIEDAFQSGAVSITDNGGRRLNPGHKEGKKEFEERFAGSNNRAPRDRYKEKLEDQASQIEATKTQTAQRV